jgi:glyoxylase-like metal-dependent hydrolase (beta-lactamase superfamily II)
MAIVEIFPHIYAIPGIYVNMFLLAEGEALTLVDSGLKGSEKRIARELAKIRRKPGEIRHVLVTHHHADHVGSLAAIKKASADAAVYVHPTDAPIVSGETRRPPANPDSMLGRIAGPIIERLPAAKPPPVAPDHLVNEGDELPIGGGIQVIHTPGHTMGSVSYLVRGHGGVLFAGDAAGHIMGRLGGSPGMFTENMDAAKASIRKLAEMQFDTACFGHGSVLKGKANAAFRRYVEKMAK